MRYVNGTNTASRDQMVQARAIERRSTAGLTLAYDRKTAKRTQRVSFRVAILRAIQSVDWRTIAIVGLLFGTPTIGALIIHYVLGG